MIGLLFAFTWDVAFPVLETRGSSRGGSRAVRFVFISAVGLLLSVLFATVSTLRLWKKISGPTTSQFWRRKGIRVFVVFVCAVALWGISKAVDHWRYEWIRTQLVGTWHLKSDGILWEEVTIAPDGNAVIQGMVGPINERKRDRLGYELSPDGQSFRWFSLPEKDGEPQSDWRDFYFIEFHGPDRFRAGYVTWKERFKYTWERVR